MTTTSSQIQHQKKEEKLERGERDASLRLLPGARTSERSSFDPRNKEGWEGEGKRRQGGRGVRQGGQERQMAVGWERERERRVGREAGERGRRGDQAS